MAAKKTRHGYMRDGLESLLHWRDKPEGNVETQQTNWSIVAANDNNPEDIASKHVERRISIRPTIDEIRNAIDTGEIIRAPDLVSENNNRTPGPIIAIGTLRFSDGTQTERAYTHGADGRLVQYDAPMPLGAMLGTTERQERLLGGDTAASNAGYRTTYGAQYSKPTKRRKKKTDEPKPLTKDEMRLASEYANNNPDMVRVFKKGFPWKPYKLRELFAGIEIGAGNGNGGSVGWEDISDAISKREVWAETIAALSDGKGAETLDIAMAAKTMREIGEAHGFKGKRAERMGKKILRAANDNLSVALKKSAA